MLIHKQNEQIFLLAGLKNTGAEPHPCHAIANVLINQVLEQQCSYYWS